MKWFIIAAVVLAVIAAAALLSGCNRKGNIMDGDGMMNTYRQISQEEAKYMMTKDDGHVVVDVRRADEYAAGHIPGAILIPNEEIGTERPAQLPDLDQIILIYCRSGNRSKQAAQKLFDMGYKRIYEFGGINTWDGEVVTEAETEIAATAEAPTERTAEASSEEEDMTPSAVPYLTANGKSFSIYWDSNSSAEAFFEKMKQGDVEVAMHDYGGFEKVGPLPWDLPRNDTEITTKPGDIILYQGNQITIYYGENTWNFTRLGHIPDVTKEELLEAFGAGDVTVTFKVEWTE